MSELKQPYVDPNKTGWIIAVVALVLIIAAVLFFKGRTDKTVETTTTTTDTIVTPMNIPAIPNSTNTFDASEGMGMPATDVINTPADNTAPNYDTNSGNGVNP